MEAVEKSENSFGLERLNVQGCDEDYSAGQRRHGHKQQRYEFPETEH